MQATLAAILTMSMVDGGKAAFTHHNLK